MFQLHLLIVCIRKVFAYIELHIDIFDDILNETSMNAIYFNVNRI